MGLPFCGEEVDRPPPAQEDSRPGDEKHEAGIPHKRTRPIIWRISSQIEVRDLYRASRSGDFGVYGQTGQIPWNSSPPTGGAFREQVYLQYDGLGTSLFGSRVAIALYRPVEGFIDISLTTGW